MEHLSYEEAVKRLEEIVKKLESGDIALQESMELFEEGVALARHCSRQLNKAEEKVKVLLESDGVEFEEVLEQEDSADDDS